VTPILAFDRVTYSYPGSPAPALADVSLEIEPGELCLLAGLSGQGKSTLLRAACGLVPHFHGGRFAGRVRIRGLDTRTHPPARLGTSVGALFQDPETQLVTSSVRAELALSLESSCQQPAAIARGVEEVALALGIDALLDRSVHELSGGEQQRVALGAALAGRPPVVLLDEPTSQLDPVAGDELIGLLRRLNQEWETTILLAEHRLERCLSAADRVIAVHGGRIVHDGPPSSFQAWAEHSQPALRTPAAQLFALAGLRPLPTGVRQARAALRARGLLPDERPVDRLENSGVGGLEGLQCSRAGGLEGLESSGVGGLEGLESSGVGGLEGLESSDVGGSEGLESSGMAGLAGSQRSETGGVAGSRDPLRSSDRSPRRSTPALRLRGVWHELRNGPAILRGVDLALEPGESIALMGRNGAGKSTLLRHAANLLAPTRGKIERAGRVALLLQNPGDYFLHERVGDELGAGDLRAAGLEHLSERNPRDLSGGERQRLALAIVAGGDQPAAVLALDEPTRGMDRAAKAELARELGRRARSGQAVIVATHDPEFAAACARRTILLADGRLIADGSAAELLAGGWYFATETARVLGGAGGALLPEEGAAMLKAAASQAPQLAYEAVL
jgi:energy-coupling factor transport system ATP-binding protein